MDATQPSGSSAMTPRESNGQVRTFEEPESPAKHFAIHNHPGNPFTDSIPEHPDVTIMVESVTNMLIAIGEDPNREGLRDTPRRVAKAWLTELFTGYGQDPAELFTVFDAENYDQMIVVQDIPVISFCEHHILPFTGVAHVGYIPSKKIVGLSKIARLVDMYARRLQVQERLTAQIADDMEEYLEPLGVMVVIKAVHTCMCLRGIQAQGSSTVTSAVRGVFVDDEKQSKAEFMSLIRA